MSPIKIVSSMDSSFAIAEMFSCGLLNAEITYISSPWIDKQFIHLMKRTVPKDAGVNLLIKTPTEYDRTFRAMEVLETESVEMRWKLDVRCVPHLHAKFTIVDDRDVYFGSPNATGAGLWNNSEVLVAFLGMPTITDHFRRIFEKIRAQEHNHHWRLVRDFHGVSIDRRLVDITVRYFQKRAYKEVRQELLILEFRKHRFTYNVAREGFRELLKQGVLYNPRKDFVKLVPSYEL